jgi:hypothetical protein
MFLLKLKKLLEQNVEIVQVTTPFLLKSSLPMSDKVIGFAATAIGAAATVNYPTLPHKDS